MLYGKTGMTVTKATLRLRDGTRAASRHMGLVRRVVNVAAVMAAVACFATAAYAQAVASSAAKAHGPIKIVAFGDSLTAGYLLPPDDAFPVVLEKALKARGVDVEIVNAGVSGDTTSAARDRLGWAVPPDADAVILELGANDALRGLDPAAARANLDAMITTIRAGHADILLAGMLAPRELGDAYTKSFDSMFGDLASTYGLVYYPFFLAATGLRPQLSLSDGLHPNAKGVAAIVADILPKVEELVARVQARRNAGG